MGRAALNAASSWAAVEPVGDRARQRAPLSTMLPNSILFCLPRCCSAVKKEQVAAGVTAAAAAVLANPLAAQAAATPSLNNLIGSVVAGGLVLAAIAGAITAVS